MAAFGGGESAWRQQTPGAYMLDVVRAAGSFGDSFSKAFSQASSQKQQGEQFDKKMAEEKRQFDTLNPAMPAERGPDAAAAPAMSSDMADFGGPNFSWDGKPSASGWQQYKAKTPTDAIGAVLGAKTVAEAADIRQANADWEANPTYRRWMDDAFKAPAAREQARNTAERVKIAASREENLTIGAQVMTDMGRKFNTDMQALAKLNDVEAQRIISMPQDNHPTLGQMPSAAQRAALGAALRVEHEKQRAAAAEQAKAAGLEPSGVNAKGGVSYSRPFAATTTGAGKLPQQNQDARKLLESEMADTRREIARLSREMGDVVIDRERLAFQKQIENLRTSLKQAERDYVQLGKPPGAATNAPPVTEQEEPAAGNGFRPVMGDVRAAERTGGPFAKPTSPPDKQADRFPSAPSDPKKRTVGTVYQTPKGPLKWTERGTWVNPSAAQEEGNEGKIKRRSFLNPYVPPVTADSKPFR